MTQTYTKGSNPYFEYVSKVFSHIGVIELMQNHNILEHINSLDFQSVANVWELIHTHLENVNLSLNAYNYPNYALPTTEKPSSKFDFITKNSKAMGAYQSGVLVNDFSYFVDSNNEAKTICNDFTQRKYEMLHKVTTFTHLENKAELASVEARKAFFEAFLTILHKLHNAEFEVKLNQINAELAPHIFISEPYIRLENRIYTYQKQETYQSGVEEYQAFVRMEEETYISHYRTERYISHHETYYTGWGWWKKKKSRPVWAERRIPVYSTRPKSIYETRTRPVYSTITIDINVPYMIEVEYQTQYGKDKLPNETPPAEPYKIKKLNGSWVTHDNQPINTEGLSDDEFLRGIMSGTIRRPMV